MREPLQSMTDRVVTWGESSWVSLGRAVENPRWLMSETRAFYLRMSLNRQEQDKTIRNLT